MAKRLTIGSRAVAVAVLEAAIEDVIANDEAVRDALHAGELDSSALADGLVRAAWDVEYKPNAEKLVLTISAGIEAPDRMRSTPEDHQ